MSGFEFEIFQTSWGLGLNLGFSKVPGTAFEFEISESSG